MNRQRYHSEAVGKRDLSASWLVGGIGRRNEDHFGKAELVERLLRDPQVGIMDGVKGPPENPDIHISLTSGILLR